MSWTEVLIWFGLGVVGMIVGADLLIRGAARLAVAIGLSPLVVGLTVVSFATSSPELAVSAYSAHTGVADLAVGNVVGSNIFNVLFILGLSAALIPLTVAPQLLRLDVWVLVGTSLLMPLLGWDGRISAVDGVLLISGLVVYTAWIVRQSRKANEQSIRETYEHAFARPPEARRSYVLSIIFCVVGLALLMLGAKWLVAAAVEVATKFGISEVIIGLTIVAAGTSLPEAAASVVATIRGERDIAVGNAVGSNVFNILGVLGVASIVAPDGLPVDRGVLRFDLPVMAAAAAACLPVFFTGQRISRWEGLLFLGSYVAYLLYLAANAQGHEYLSRFRTAMWYVAPLVVATVVVVAFRSWRAQRAAAPSAE